MQALCGRRSEGFAMFSPDEKKPVWASNGNAEAPQRENFLSIGFPGEKLLKFVCLFVGRL
jgi:hypothetical protein